MGWVWSRYRRDLSADILRGIYNGGGEEDIASLIRAYEKAARVNYSMLATYFKVSLLLGQITQ